MVYDTPRVNRSSAIAAGLFNPITGKLMQQTWLADKIFPALHQFYQAAESELGNHFFYPHPLYRPFLSVEEQNEWMGKSSAVGLNKYIKQIFSASAYGNQVHDPLGGLLLDQCGYLDVVTFMEAVRKKLDSLGSFREEEIMPDQLIIKPTEVAYGEVVSSAVIFCQGTFSSRFFPALLVRTLKGETLTISLDQKPELIYNRGVYIVPAKQPGLFKVGATYETRNLTEGITESGRNELLQKLGELLVMPFEVKGQDWGVRPTSPDRRPMLGSLPDSKNVVIFNGLGTKGVSLAPYFSGQLADWLCGKGEILPEVNITRFKSLFSKSS